MLITVTYWATILHFDGNVQENVLPVRMISDTTRDIPDAKFDFFLMLWYSKTYCNITAVTWCILLLLLNIINYVWLKALASYESYVYVIKCLSDVFWLGILKCAIVFTVAQHFFLVINFLLESSRKKTQNSNLRICINCWNWVQSDGQPSSGLSQDIG